MQDGGRLQDKLTLKLVSTWLLHYNSKERIKMSDCKDMPLFTNKNYGGICEQEGTECERCIELHKKNKAEKNHEEE